MLTILLAALLQEEALPTDLRQPLPSAAEGSFAAHGRWMDASGSVAGGLRYSDLFHSGPGLNLEAGLSWDERSVGYGFYGSFGFDRQEGQRFTDDVGDSIRPEAMDVATVSVGGTFDLFIQESASRDHRFLIRLFAGPGAAFYESVDADFVVGGTMTSAELFDSSVRPLFDAGLRTGMSGRSFAFTLGLRVRWDAGPERGSGVTAGIDPGGRTSVGFELGWEFRW